MKYYTEYVRGIEYTEYHLFRRGRLSGTTALQLAAFRLLGAKKLKSGTESREQRCHPGTSTNTWVIRKLRTIKPLGIASDETSKAPRAHGPRCPGYSLRDPYPGEPAALRLSRLRQRTGMYRDGRSASATVHRQHSRQEEEKTAIKNMHPVFADRRFGSSAWESSIPLSRNGPGPLRGLCYPLSFIIPWTIVDIANLRL